MMKFSLKETADAYAWRFFNRPLPMTHDELKSCFRAACKRLHTDTSGSNTKEEFIQMKLFYEELQSKPWAFTDNSVPCQTTGGDFLSELGLGLGMKNGRDCAACNHKGYTEEKLSGWQRCTWCDYGWSYSQPCLRCQGTGNGPKQVSKACPSCKGNGIHLFSRVVKCRMCDGSGGKNVPLGTVVYHTCYQCKGAGEIEIYNPVIPKEWLANP